MEEDGSHQCERYRGSEVIGTPLQLASFAPFARLALEIRHAVRVAAQLLRGGVATTGDDPGGRAQLLLARRTTTTAAIITTPQRLHV